VSERKRNPGVRRPRSGARRRVLSTVLIVAGLLLLADVLTTVVWQEPVTAVIGLIKQGEVSHRYLSYEDTPLSVDQRGALRQLVSSEQRIAYLAAQEQREVPNGAALGRLVIPKIGVSYYVVQGAAATELERGPGHYRSTALPGMGKTVAIAGHRTTYLAPFRNINALHAGARIELRMPYGRFTYVVTHQQVVRPNAWWITGDRGYDQLVLSACNPLYSATQRIAVFARLQSVTPTGPALRH
jgi:sortase A